MSSISGSSTTSKRSKLTSSNDSDEDEIAFLSREKINLEAAVLLLRSDKLKNLKYDTGEMVFGAYRRTLNLAIHLGYIPVSYRVPKSGFGRYNARVAINDSEDGFMQHYTTMQREIRNLLADKYYMDVDFVNCHPVILEQLLARHRIPCPLLTHYIEKRELCLGEVVATCGVSRDSAKDLFIRLSYMGSVAEWMKAENITIPPPGWVSALAKELSSNALRIIQRPELDALRLMKTKHLREGSSIPIPIVASILAVYIQTQERLCLDALREAVEQDGFEVGALIYDGLHVRKSDEVILGDAHLVTWKAHILTCTNFELDLKLKPFELDNSWLESASPHVDPKWDDTWMDGSSAMTYAHMKKRWEQRAFKAVVIAEFVREERGKHAIYTKGKLTDAYEHLKCCTIQYYPSGEGVLVKSVFIKQWIADDLIRTYKYMDTYPPPLECPCDVYNCWTGFAAAKYVVPEGMVLDTNSIGVRALVNHLDVLLSRDSGSLEYVLNWIAQILQKPAVKPGIALLIKGGEGVGKNRFTDLLKLMLGEGLFLETANPEHVLFGRFTDSRLGKVLIVINEASGADNHAAKDSLKDMIVSQTFVWEAKGVNSSQMMAYDRFIFTTNNSNVLKINPDSRRYVVFEVSGELKGNTTYFKALSAHIADPHTRCEFYTLLMSRDLSAIDWLNDRPLTQYYHRMVEQNLPREWEFLKTVLLLPAYAEGRLVVEKTPTELFEGFQAWLLKSVIGEGGKYSTNTTKFGTKLGELVSGSSAMPGVSKNNRKTQRTYEFDVEVFVAAMVTSKWVHPSDLPLRGFSIV